MTIGTGQGGRALVTVPRERAYVSARTALWSQAGNPVES